MVDVTITDGVSTEPANWLVERRAPTRRAALGVPTAAMAAMAVGVPAVVRGEPATVAPATPVSVTAVRGMAAAVGPVRYRIGLVMFSVPIIIGLAQPYLAHSFPVLSFNSLTQIVLLDVMFITSLLVLGAGFWDKLSALFHPG